MANNKRKARPLKKSVPKRQKTLVGPITKAKLSERIVDEILKTPELVSKVVSLLIKIF